MSITEIGREGELLARDILKDIFKADRIFQADWMIKKNGKWYVVEVKHKERFKPPPFEGQGLNKYQVDQRLAFYEDTGIRCLFLVLDKDEKLILWNWLDILNRGQYYDTKKGIRIYPIAGFKQIGRYAPC